MWQLTTIRNRAYLLLKQLFFFCESDYTFHVIFQSWSSVSAFICTLGPWSESSVGGSSGVGEGYAALAFSSTGPGQTLSPPSANHRPQRCFNTPADQWRQVQKGHVPSHHGVRSTGECPVQLYRSLCKQFCICSDKLSLFCPSFRWRCCWNSRSLPTTLNRRNGTFQATPHSRLS